jgi:response regulator RpfG family c-di-GMP phosphodiesterase
MNNETILIVDDEPNILLGITRNLHKQFNFETASSGQQALEILQNNPHIAVLMTDLQMPGMNGLELLSKAQKITPNCVRLMLSGNADLAATIQAVNEGQVFRFLTKPCEPVYLSRMLQTAMDQYRLVTAERTLLDKTLNGSVEVLTEIIALVDPEIFGKSRMIRAISKAVAHQMKLDSWPIEMAAMLSRVSSLTLPASLLVRERTGGELSPVEKETCQRIPQASAELLSKIPRLEVVSEIILYQYKSFNGTGFPQDEKSGTAIPIGARIMKCATDFLRYYLSGNTPLQSVELMRMSEGIYDPEITQALVSSLGEIQKNVFQSANKTQHISKAQELRPGQVTQTKIETVEGVLIVRAGETLQGPLIQKIINFSNLYGLKYPIVVMNLSEGEESVSH